MDRKGTPVGDLREVSISPRQKYSAISILKPRVPLMSTVSIRDQGTATVALVISSTIWCW